MLKKITIAAVTLFAASFMMNTAFAASRNDANTNAKSAMQQVMPTTTKTSAQVLAWANQAVAAAYTSKGHHAASSYFTRSAWQDFHKSMKVTGQIHANSKKLAVTTGTPVIIAQGTFNNMPAWQVQVPLVVAHQNQQDTVMANMVVVQCSKKSAVDGLVATQFNVANQS